uniref:Uncharacterized protein n=1 Tax=Romanomermis culicivorax TaxID=13658 RepID=A0A915KXX0_ROMCU
MLFNANVPASNHYANFREMKSHGQYEIHSKHNSIDEIAIFHQCNAPKMQTDLRRRLCQSFVTNDTMVLKMHALYCDI